MLPFTLRAFEMRSISHARIASKSLVISYSNFSAAIALYLRQKMGGQLWVMGRRAVCFSEARVGPASC
jgi:hypothetical protein